MQPLTFVYKPDWGCPLDGEKGVSITLKRHPKYHQDQEAWRESALRIARQLQESLGEESVQLTLYTGKNIGWRLEG